MLLFSHGNDDLPTNHFRNRRVKETQENKTYKGIHFDLRRFFTSENKIPAPQIQQSENKVPRRHERSGLFCCFSCSILVCLSKSSHDGSENAEPTQNCHYKNKLVQRVGPYKCSLCLADENSHFLKNDRNKEVK